jgi:hypothetical protein
MASERWADEDGEEPTTGVKRIPSVVKTRAWNAVPELDHAVVRPERATQRPLEPRTGKTLVNQLQPAPVPRHRLEPQTGKTLIATPLPEPVPAVGHGLEPQTGKTLIATAPVVHDSSRPRGNAPGDLPLPVPPESNRLAARLTPPASVPRTHRSTWVGGYEVLARIRRSTRGTDYLCRPGEDPQARCLLTVLRRQLTTAAERDSFLRDANRLAKRVHPHLLGLLDAGVYQQQPYLVRPRCEGVTLDRLLEATPPASRRPRLMLRIFEEALEALARVHEPDSIDGQPTHFVHGALAADQLLITTEGRTLVMGVGEVKMSGMTVDDPSEDLLALGILINTALSGGVDENVLHKRWLTDARGGRRARASELLREFRRVKSRSGVFARSEEIAEWVASVRRRDRSSTIPARESFPSLTSEATASSARSGWLGSLRSWWTRRSDDSQ